MNEEKATSDKSWMEAAELLVTMSAKSSQEEKIEALAKALDKSFQEGIGYEAMCQRIDKARKACQKT